MKLQHLLATLALVLPSLSVALLSAAPWRWSPTACILNMASCHKFAAWGSSRTLLAAERCPLDGEQFVHPLWTFELFPIFGHHK